LMSKDAILKNEYLRLASAALTGILDANCMELSLKVTRNGRERLLRENRNEKSV
jgi:hypothetical protein